jgi:exopolysaccharide biosynthesis polyprenyl glycosylphosphotransferase
MTPPAASHAADPRAVPLQSLPLELSPGTLNRLFQTRNWSRLRTLVDATVLWLGTTMALLGAHHLRLTTVSRVLAAGFPLLVLAVLHTRPGPDDRLDGSLIDTCAHLLGVVSISAMLMIALDSMLGNPHPVGIAIRLWVFALVYLAVARMVLLSIRRHALCRPAWATPTLVVGAGMVGEHLVNRLIGEPRYGLRPVGFIDTDPLASVERSPSQWLPVLGGPDDLPAAIEQTGARKLIVAFSSDPDRLLVENVQRCRAMGVEVALVPRMFELVNERSTLDHVGGLPLLSLEPTDPRSWRFAVKHAIDRGVAGLGLLALSPLLLVIAVAVRFSSPGPIFFRQRRVGRDGRVFDVLKFRTMLEPGDPYGEFFVRDGCAPGGVEGADRRTRVGRLLRSSSLDELPQLINVLRGDMSLVGPRPERPEFVDLFSEAVDRYDARHRVKSGITGWAQVNGLRGQTSIADRVEWDNHYIQNWSLALDLRILAMTVVEVLRFRDGA